MDRAQFEQHALSHLDAVYRMAMQLTGHPEDASDLVQETYLKALAACSRFEDRGGGMRPWLFKILHNVFYSSKRRETRSPKQVESLEGLADDDRRPDGPPPAWDIGTFDWEQVDQRLKRAVDGLCAEHRTVLLLWGVEGLKYREIAEIQNIPIGTVMSRLHRARSLLAAELSELAEEIRVDPR